ncbi:MAG TPA: aminoacyl-tRNA hydrolase [Dehalococcoidia bacterium]|nr:aminoacyl-tRNA hydrolase [Dehalococcoidia bacterium]
MATDRWLIAGLGNPGPEYSHNRHNVGYWCINRLARLHGINLKAKSLATIGEGDMRGVPVVLLKPRTYVNRSGGAIGPALKRWNIDPHNLILIYDELDLPAGRVRIRPTGGSGGHNGLKSIIGAAGTQDFARIRVGIGRPHVDGKPTWEPRHVGDYVLSDPPPEMVKTLQDAVKRTADAVEMILTEGVEAAMNKYNK